MSDYRAWVDGDHCKQISAAMSEVYEAFDRAYFKSPTNADLMRNTGAALDALKKVRRHVCANKFLE